MKIIYIIYGLLCLNFLSPLKEHGLSNFCCLIRLMLIDLGYESCSRLLSSLLRFCGLRTGITSLSCLSLSGRLFCCRCLLGLLPVSLVIRLFDVLVRISIYLYLFEVGIILFYLLLIDHFLSSKKILRISSWMYYWTAKGPVIFFIS